MSDLISRQDAIALLESIRKRRKGDFPYEQFAMEQAIEALANMPSHDQLILRDMANGMAVTRDGVRVDPHDVFTDKP